MALSAQGTEFHFADADGLLIKVGSVMGYSGFDGEAPDIQITTFDDSEFHQFRQGLMDNGSFSIDVYRDPEDAGQAEMESACNLMDTRQCVLTIEDWGTVTFEAYVKSLPISGNIDEMTKGTINLKISGEVVWQEAA